MKRIISCILSILALLLAFSHNVSATRQARDIIIIDKVEHRLNKVLLFQLDSVTYDALGKRLEFDKSSHSANWRGHVSTFEVRDNKLYLNSIATFKEHTDFCGLLDQYKDRRGRVFASWVSGTFICGTGGIILFSPDGVDDFYERETELVVEDGVIVSSRTYTNRTRNTPGVVSFEDVRYRFPKEFQYDKFPDVKGRVFVQMNASEFDNEGKITDWDVTILRCPESLTEDQKAEIIAEVTRVLRQYDWKTYMRCGNWYWSNTRNSPLTWPLIFK
ncbi:MAG: hypothetical protein J6A91_08730 [Bacteroidales bacterium]|nr:hypothetical protein [Bacteroidales bacterium]